MISLALAVCVWNHCDTEKLQDCSQSDTFPEGMHDGTLLLIFCIVGTMSACSLCGAAFLPVALGILSELMVSRMLKSRV